MFYSSGFKVSPSVGLLAKQLLDLLAAYQSMDLPYGCMDLPGTILRMYGFTLNPLPRNSVRRVEAPASQVPLLWRQGPLRSLTPKSL